MIADHLLLAFAIGQSALLILLLAAARSRAPGAAYIIGALICFAGLFSVVLAKDLQGPAVVQRLDLAFGLALAPLLTLHATSITLDRRTNLARDLKWFAPAALALAYALGAPLPRPILLVVMLVSLTVSALWSIFALSAGRRSTASGPQPAARWPAYAQLAFSAVVLLGLAQHFSESFDAAAISVSLTRATFLGFLALAALLAVAAAKTPAFTAGRLPALETQPRNFLSDYEAARLQKSLVEAMTERELYKRPQLQVLDLADFVLASRESVTEAIRRGLGANFFDFVNQHRIEAAKRRLADSAEAIDAIMLDIGFRSKSSFYSEFKKRVGVSPGRFRAENHRCGGSTFAKSDDGFSSSI